MFKKLLAAIGVGGASVDTRLLNASLQPGQTFEARIVLKGGEVSQSIAGLELALMTRVKVSDGDSSHFINHCLASWRISEGFELQAGEERELPFIGQLHPETPFTELPVCNNQCRVWLQTGLAIDYAIDPGDQDLLQIQPTQLLLHLLQAMEELGFVLKKADVEQGYINTSGFRSGSGCYQELEFVPAGLGIRLLREVELTLVPAGKQTHILLELDRAFRGDGYLSLTLDNQADYPQVLAALQPHLV
ncbi:sporulation protein [Shewanella algae]|uniref:sporulation protein n=1 Tax=Shewanella algae TaxID=38313 RepID=UPI001BF17052|nr:sporulation protein [Shewanella algae]BCV29737.1 sporulation-control protein [Shewanella algae]HDS1208977.1 sporulation protein [Shewanella algae]